MAQVNALRVRITGAVALSVLALASVRNAMVQGDAMYATAVEGVHHAMAQDGVIIAMVLAVSTATTLASVLYAMVLAIVPIVLAPVYVTSAAVMEDAPIAQALVCVPCVEDLAYAPTVMGMVLLVILRPYVQDVRVEG